MPPNLILLNPVTGRIVFPRGLFFWPVRRPWSRPCRRSSSASGLGLRCAKGRRRYWHLYWCGRRILLPPHPSTLRMNSRLIYSDDPEETGYLTVSLATQPYPSTSFAPRTTFDPSRFVKILFKARRAETAKSTGKTRGSRPQVPCDRRLFLVRCLTAIKNRVH